MLTVPSTRLALRLFGLLLLLFAQVSFAAAEWKEQVLYSFQGGTDGATPVGSIVIDAAGNLYGATTQGGSQSCNATGQCGTVFQLSPPPKPNDPWVETILHVFKGKAFGDGDTPVGGLTVDEAGNLYGSTGYGGTGNCQLQGILVGCGTVFELSPPSQSGGSWTETVLYSFRTSEEGYIPEGDLVFDRSGNLYGATYFGGGFGTSCNNYYQYCGAIFELSPPTEGGSAWTEKLLHAFSGTGPDAVGDGANPNGSLVLDSFGDLYGTTYFGGSALGRCGGGAGGIGCGSVFVLRPPTSGYQWSEQILYRFDVPHGINPGAGLALDESGNLFGTTVFGAQRYGAAFELQRPGAERENWTEYVLYTFNDGNDGGSPMSPVTFGEGGSMYLTTSSSSGSHNGGTLLNLMPAAIAGHSLQAENVYDFEGHGDGAYPAAKLVFDQAGTIYSTTTEGGTGELCEGEGGCGTVYRIQR
jgi:hypothetical protein